MCENLKETPAVKEMKGNIKAQVRKENKIFKTYNCT